METSESPLVSIVIPTRDRARYLEHSIRTAVLIPDDNIEIVVSDNASIDDTEEVISSFSDSRIRHLSTGSRLAMRQNFEFALSECRGDYVIFFGDDDGIIPGQFRHLRAIIEEHRPDAISWDFPIYGWPVEGYGHRVGGLRFAKSRCFGHPFRMSNDMLRKKMEFGRLDLLLPLPAIYHGCMSTAYLRSLARADGTCILARSPDTYVNFRATQQGGNFIHCHHPFSVNGHSPASNGGNLNAQGRSAKGAALAGKFATEMKTDPIDDVIPLTKSIPFGFLSTLETVRDNFPDPEVKPDYVSWYREIVMDYQRKEAETGAEILGMLTDYAAKTGTEQALQEAHGKLGIGLRRLSIVLEKNRRKINSFRVGAAIDGENTIETAALTCDRLLGDDYAAVSAGSMTRSAAWTRMKSRR